MLIIEIGIKHFDTILALFSTAANQKIAHSKASHLMLYSKQYFNLFWLKTTLTNVPKCFVTLFQFIFGIHVLLNF